MPTVKAKPEDSALFEKLASVNIESAWGALANLGYPDTFINCLTSVHPDKKMVGRARTIRCLPVRQDVREKVGNLRLNCRSADDAEPGDVVVIDAGGITSGGYTGDVVTSRLIRRGGVGLVIDGALRDLSVLRAMDICAYATGFHAAGPGHAMMDVDYQVPINCGGVTVVPGDILVGDCEGILVIPAQFAQEVAEKALETDRKESFLRHIIETEEHSIYDVYPPNAELQRRYEAWKRKL